MAEAIRYALVRWSGLVRFLDDGRIEIDSNAVERTIRPIALNRKNVLCAGSDGGGEHWAILASRIESCKLNAVDPQAYLAEVLARLVAGRPPAASTISCPGTGPPTRSFKGPPNTAYEAIARFAGLRRRRLFTVLPCVVMIRVAICRIQSSLEAAAN